MSQNKYWVSETQLSNLTDGAGDFVSQNSLSYEKLVDQIYKQTFKARELVWTKGIWFKSEIAIIHKNLTYVVDYSDAFGAGVCLWCDEFASKSIFLINKLQNIDEAKQFAQSHFNQMYEEMSE